MNFRPADTKDARAISALIRQFSGEFTVRPDGEGAEQFFESVSVRAEVAYISDPRYQYLVATEGAKLVGFIAIRDKGHIFHLFVVAESQRRRLASQLWQSAKQEAVSQGITKFTVNSSPGAIPVYKRFGFSKAGEPIEAHGIRFVPMCLVPANAGA